MKQPFPPHISHKRLRKTNRAKKGTPSPSSARTRFVQPCIEWLESRVLLDGTPSGLAGLLESGRVAPIRWHGEEVQAFSGEWIIRLDGPNGTSPAPLANAQNLLDSVPEVALARRLDRNGAFLVQTDPGLTYEQLAAALDPVPGLRYLEPNFVLHVNETFPSDSLFPQLWGLHNTGQNGGTPGADIDAPLAWDSTTGSANVVVAGIDTGIDYTHPDLAPNIWTNPGEVPGDGLDNDGNGYIDDIHGIDTANGDADPFDDHGHGTHTAGTIGAVGDNGFGVTGVNWNVQIMGLKFLDASGSGSLAAAIEAIDYMTMMKRDYGVNVVVSNNSWSGGGYSQAMYDAIAASIDEGIVFVAAAGNDSNNNDLSPAYPASYNLDGIIAVAATDRDDQLAFFSNYGASSVDVGAPGVDIISTFPGNRYAANSGTSMAAPHVAGAVALLAAAAPQASVAELKAAILAGADPVSGLGGVTLTGARLNVFGALETFGIRVVSSQPASGEVVFTPPTQFTFDFSEPYDPASIDAGDLLVNGVPADSVELVDPDTLRFTFDVSPVVDEGLQSMTLPAGAIARASDGDTNAAYNGSFRYDATLLQVTATTPAEGATALLPFTTLRLHFNEPITASSVGLDDLTLSQGTVVAASALDAETAEYTLADITEEGTFTFQLHPGAVTDAFGNPGAAYTGSLQLDVDTEAFPLPLEPTTPLGSLIYTGSRAGAINDAGDTDDRTIALDAGQTVTLVVDPDTGLRPTITLLDPAGNPVGSAVAPLAGADALVQTIPTTLAGTYTITVGSADDTTGGYQLQLILNAAVEEEEHDGAANNSQADAQPLDAGFLTLDGSVARAAVLGTLPASPGVPFFTEDFDGATHTFTFDNGYGSGNGLWHASTGRQGDGLGGHSSPGNLYFGTGETDTAGGNYDVGTATGGAALSPWITLPDEGQVTLSFAHFLATEGDPSWDRAEVLLDTGSEVVSLLSTEDGTLPTSTGGLWQTVAVDLTPYRGQDVRLLFAFDSFDTVQNGFEGWFIDDVTLYGPGPAVSDFYRVDLGAGESLSAALASSSAAGLELDVLDASGARLALASPSDDLAASLHTFVAPQPGTYTLRVTGQGTYSLVLTRNADFDREPNNSVDAAQPLPSGAVLGYLSDEPAIGTAGGSGTGNSGGSQPGADYVPGRLVVRFAEGLTAEDESALAASFGGTILKRLPIIHGALIQLPEGQSDVTQAAADWTAHADVVYAEPDFILHVEETFPSDPLFGDLWGLHNTGQNGGTPGADIDAPLAWDSLTGSQTVVIAGIDTGIDYTHPDLAPNMWVNPGEVPGDGLDNDGNGYIDDVYGIDTANGDSDPADDHGHGTHTAGTFGAVGDNGIGVVGVNWNVQIMALKFITSSGSGSLAGAIEAIDYMTMMKRDYGVNIVASNNSWAGGDFSQALYDAIAASTDAGIVFVAAAGNDGKDNDASPSYPASYDLDGIIAVAATDSDDSLAYFSNYGASSVDLAAPGVDIISTLPGGGYGSSSGTSMAAPHVTGAVALLAAAAPDATVAELKAAILAGADPVPGLGGFTLTGGRLNVAEALQALGDPGDYYQVEVAAGDVLTIRTRTPGDGPLAFPNTLDPAVELYDPAGSLVASDDDSAADGRNAELTYTASTAGTYTVRVLSTSGPGEYLLTVGGATGLAPAPTITATTPADGEGVIGAPAELTVSFSNSVLLSSLSPADLLIDGSPAPDIRTITTNNEVVFELPALSEGPHSFEVPAGSIFDIQGRAFTGFQGTFTVDLSTHPISTRDLVAYWNFDEGSGTTAADTAPFGGDHTGTLQGDPEWNAFGRNGSLGLDGNGDFVAVPNSPDLNTTDQRDRTVSVWFYARDPSISSRKQVIYEEGGSSRGLNIYVFDGRLYVGGWNTPGSESGWAGTFLSTDQIQPGQWHHVALTLDGSRTLEPDAFTAYLDGVAFGSGEGSRLWTHAGNIGIGQVTGVQESPTGTTKFHTGDSPDDGDGLFGLVDEVRIYNRVLTPAEVQLLAGQTLTDPVLLDVAIADDSIWENGGSTTATVARQGDTSDPLTVTLTSSDSFQVSIPASVTIPAGQTQTTFTITALDNSLAEGAQTVAVTASAAGYVAGQDQVVVLDDEPAIADLVAYWDFNEGSGTVAHDTSPFGQDNTGSLQGDAGWNAFGLAGSLTLDGEADFVAIPDSPDINTSNVTQRTISAWFYVHETAPASGPQVIFEEGGTTRGLNIYIDGGRLYVGGWNTPESGWQGTFLSTDQIQPGQWHHVALVLHGGTTVTPDALRAYLDGTQFGSGSGSQVWAHGGDVGIGRATGDVEGPTGTTKLHTGDVAADGLDLHGLIDEVRIYNRALTDPEIQVLAGQGLDEPVRLTLTVAADSVFEDAGSTTATVAREGDTSAALTVTLTSDDTSEASVPASVTIPAGQAQASFTVTILDDALADGPQTVTLTASADGYLESKDKLVVLDDEPAEAGLVAYWNFNEGSGSTANDTSPEGGDNSATLQGDADWTPFGLGGSLLLDGAGDFVAVPDSPDINTSNVTQRTISAWFYVEDTSATQVIFEEGGTTRGLNIYVDGDRLYVGGWNTPESGWQGTFLSTDQIQSGQWHHVALVLDGGTSVAPDALRAYLDGTQFGSGSGSQVWAHFGDVGIGRTTGDVEGSTGTTKLHTGDVAADGLDLRGLVDEVRVYNRALTDPEIQVLAGQGLSDPVRLTLTVDADSVFEDAGSITATVAREGDTSDPLTVTLTSDDTTEASVPASVTIPAGQAQASFVVTILDDALADGPQTVTLTASATGYLDGEDTLVVQDDEPAEADLVAYWNFNEGSGSVANDTSPEGGNNTATLQGDTSWNPFGSDQSLTFDGLGDYVDIPDSPDINTSTVTQRTVAAWFYVEDASITSRKQVIFEEGGSERGLNLYVFDGRLYVGGWNTPSSESGWAGTFLSTDQIQSGQWHHVALVLDGGTTVTSGALTGYLDGVAFASGSGSQLWAHAGDSAIGRVDGAADDPAHTTRFHTGPVTANGDEWQGLIDEVRIYNRALSAPEVQTLAGLTMKDPVWLTLTISADSMPENGGTAQATVSRPTATGDPLTVTLASSDTTEATVPASVTIAAGETEASFTITAVDDSIFDPDQTVTITASAAGFFDGRDTLTVTDDDLPQANLMAYWDFDEGSGSVAHDTSPFGQDNTGSLQGDAGWNAFGLAGSLTLDGEADFVAIPDSPDINTANVTQRTISAWFYVHDTSATQVIFEEGGTTRGLNIYIDGGRLYVGGWNTPESGWQGTFLSTDQIQPGHWHHVALVLQGGSSVTPDALRAYLDGTQFGVGSGSQVWAHGGDIGIGRATGDVEGPTGTTKLHTGDVAADGLDLHGLIDEVRVYNRALTDPEIQALAGQTLTAPLVMTLTFSAASIPENGGTATATLTRGGDTSADLVVSLLSSDTTEATVPASVTISAGQTQASFTVTAQDDDFYDGPQTVKITASAPGYLATTGKVTVTDDEHLLQTGVVANVTNSWTTVTLPQNYQSMVVVATPNPTSSGPPLVTRIRNATGNSFEVRVDRADGSSGSVAGIPVHYLVVEEGVYTQETHGVKMEAVTFTATVTDRSGSWNGQVRSYANSYAQPVVIGQVMTYNDPDFSVFWTRGPSVGDPPTSSTLRVGKHVGQDPDTTRADETVGYIVIEAGNGTMDGVKYTAGLGADTVVGVDDGPPVSYPLSGLTSAGTALVSQAGMDGNDGSWAILAGSNPVTATSLNLSVDEDQLADSERLHTTEQVAYLVFEDTGASGASFVTGDSKPGESLSTTQPEGSEEGATGRSSPPTGGVSKADRLASRPGQGAPGTVLLVSPAQRKPDLFTMLDQEVGQRSPSVALSLGGVRDMGVSGSVSLPQVAGTPFATDPSQPALVPLSLLVGRQDSAKVFRPGGQDVVVGGPLLQAEATPREAQPDHVEPDAVGAGREDTAVLDRLFSGEAEETAWGSDWLDEVFREGLYP